MSTTDLASDQHEWLEASIAGAELKARMYPLHVDLVRGTRSVLLTFPDGWNRPSTGTQPAGEEFVPLTGALTLSGHRVGAGEVLVATPRCLRSNTFSEDGTRAVVFFSGPGGGWEDGDASVCGTIEKHALVDGFVRPETEDLVGRLELLDALPEDGLDVDVECVWIDAQKYAFVPRGGIPPQVEGRVVVRRLP